MTLIDLENTSNVVRLCMNLLLSISLLTACAVILQLLDCKR